MACCALINLSASFPFLRVTSPETLSHSLQLKQHFSCHLQIFGLLNINQPWEMHP